MTLYYISAVRMDASNQHIEYVKIIKGGKGEADTTINSRQFVAELINDGATKFKTITKKMVSGLTGQMFTLSMTFTFRQTVTVPNAIIWVTCRSFKRTQYPLH